MTTAAPPRAGEGESWAAKPPARRRGRWRLERRSRAVRVGGYRALGGAIGTVIAIVALPAVASVSSGTLYSSLWGGLSNSFGIQSVLTAAIPLALAGVAVALPYRLGLWNVGVDGQMFVGAWVAAAIAFSLPHLNGVPLVALMFVGSALGGTVWIAGPALARAYLGVNEIITTFLMNFVAAAWLAYWANGPWKGTLSVGGTQSRNLPSQANLGTITVGQVSVQGGIVIAIIVPVVIWAGFRFLRIGYEALVVGSNARAGLYAGISVKRRLVGAMLLGGAIGGLAGAVEMIGDVHAYTNGITNNTGFAALVLAVLAGGHELAVAVVALLYAVLSVAGDQLSTQGVSTDAVLVVVGFALLTAALGDAAARFRLVRTRRSIPVAEG